MDAKQEGCLRSRCRRTCEKPHGTAGFFLIERQTGSALAANEAKGHVPERCMPLFAAALIWRSPYDLFFKACFVNGYPAAQPFDARRLIVIQPSLRLHFQAADQGK